MERSKFNFASCVIHGSLVAIPSPLGYSPARVVLGPKASPKRARAPEGVCGVDLTCALN